MTSDFPQNPIRILFNSLEVGMLRSPHSAGRLAAAKRGTPRESPLHPRNTPLMKMGEMIDHHPPLETLLITQNGKPTEKLLGIANRLDIHAAI